MKPQRKNYAPRGIGIGFGVFVLLAAVCLVTPLRQPLLAVAGREAPALTLRLEAQRDTMDALQTRASERHLAPAERAALKRARDGYDATRERIDARARMNARFSLFGLFDWIRELFPWLVAFGLALPVLGGLIGAQVGTYPRTPARAEPDAANPPSVPLDRPRPVPPVTPAVLPAQAGKAGAPPTPRPAAPVRQPYVHPAVAAAATAIPPSSAPSAPSQSVAQRPLPGSPVILPPDIVTPAAPSSERAMPASPLRPDDAPNPADQTPAQDWGFRHSPTPLESRPRPKMPPVRSPHSLDGLDDPEDPIAG